MSDAAAVGPAEAPIQAKSLRALTSLMLKRTYDMFVGNYGLKILPDEDAQRVKIAAKVSGADKRRLAVGT